MEVKDFWDDKYKEFNPFDEVEGDLFIANKKLDLKGKKILIIAVGTGKEVVRAARMGAEVYGIDISSNAVKNAQAMLEANSLEGKMFVGDGANTSFDSNYFDIVWGSAVLHHLEHESFSKELNRILKDNGISIFVDEPTFFNPLIRFSYETLFGKGRDGRRRKFLFFERRGDDFEKPIDKKDLIVYEKYFSTELIPEKFMFIEKISHVLFPYNNKAHSIFSKIDLFFLYLFPGLKRHSYQYHFIFKKC
tara:strand:+ start:3350 stop:4093 length:744 start_codon:yes stop_codon:yes gene_type:complete